MREKIVIIGAGEFQYPLIRKAKEMGFETHVFAWKCKDIGARTADYFYPISIREKERILEECRHIQPAAVTSIGSDLAVPTVHYISRELGLNANSGDCDKAATNKYEMRLALKNAGIWTPKFYRVSGSVEESLAEELMFPVIVKPTDRSGSRAVSKVYSKQDLQKAVRAAVGQSFEKKAMIEEEIEGMEYSCECISFHGQHTCLAFTKKYTTGAPHYIETGHYEPAEFMEGSEEKIRKQIFQALDALDIKNSASHSEFRLDREGNVKIIEIGARMGGDCIGSHLVELSTGIDFVKTVIQTAMGIAPQIKATRSKAAGIRFVLREADKAVLMEAQKNHAENIVYVSNMKKERKVEDSTSRMGYFIACTEDVEQLIQILHF